MLLALLAVTYKYFYSQHINSRIIIITLISNISSLVYKSLHCLLTVVGNILEILPAKNVYKYLSKNNMLTNGVTKMLNNINCILIQVFDCF